MDDEIDKQIDSEIYRTIDCCIDRSFIVGNIDKQIESLMGRYREMAKNIWIGIFCVRKKEESIEKQKIGFINIIR